MLLWHALTKLPDLGALCSLQMGNGAGWCGMDVEVYLHFSGVSWIASLLCADSYLLTAGPQATSYSFLLINEKIRIVQHIKDFLSSLPAWVLSALLLGLVEVGVKCVSTAAHSCICVSLVGPCRPVS